MYNGENATQQSKLPPLVDKKTTQEELFVILDRSNVKSRVLKNPTPGHVYPSYKSRLAYFNLVADLKEKDKFRSRKLSDLAEAKIAASKSTESKISHVHLINKGVGNSVSLPALNS